MLSSISSEDQLNWVSVFSSSHFFSAIREMRVKDGETLNQNRNNLIGRVSHLELWRRGSIYREMTSVMVRRVIRAVFSGWWGQAERHMRKKEL